MVSARSEPEDDEWVPTSEPITREQVEDLNRLLSLRAEEGVSICLEDDE